MNMVKVSVVVPIFGVEKYIERCARSLFEQTLDDIEYIFVNDCTRDKSMEILDAVISEYPHRKSQVTIINHSENRGLPSARKTGICVAKGDYIIQCDSDDWVDVKMYQTMYDAACKSDADVAICGYYTTDGISKVAYVTKETSKDNYIRDCLIQKSSSAIWSKLFKRELFSNKIEYPIDAMGEDNTLVLQLIHYCNKIVFVESPLYFYFSNLNSISKTLNPDKIYQCFKQSCNNIEILERFFEDNGLLKDLQNSLYCYKHKQRNILVPLLSNKQYYLIWKNTFSSLNHRVLFMPISLRDKIFFILRYFKLK